MSDEIDAGEVVTPEPMVTTSLRLPSGIVDRLRAEAAARGIRYTSLIRDVLIPSSASSGRARTHEPRPERHTTGAGAHGTWGPIGRHSSVRPRCRAADRGRRGCARPTCAAEAEVWRLRRLTDVHPRPIELRLLDARVQLDDVHPVVGLTDHPVPATDQSADQPLPLLIDVAGGGRRELGVQVRPVADDVPANKVVEAAAVVVLSPFVLAELDYLVMRRAGVRGQLALLTQVARTVRRSDSSHATGE